MNFASLKINAAILKQAIRDVGSSNSELKKNGLEYFLSDDFLKISQELGIDSGGARKNVLRILEYPQVSRKRISDWMARMVDKRITRKANG